MLEKWIVRHWKTLCIGCVTTGILLRVQFDNRGFFCIGGEWFIIPALLALEYTVRLVRKEMGGSWKNFGRYVKNWKKTGTY